MLSWQIIWDVFSFAKITINIIKHPTLEVW